MYSQKPPKPTRRFSSITGTPFLEHPAAQGGSFNIQHEAEPSHDQNVPAMPRSVSNSSSGTVLHHDLQPSRVVSSRTTSDKPMVTYRETAERLAQAAKQLYEQVKESIGIYQSFYDKYNQDINSVRDYVNAVTRRQIWRNKVDQNKKFSQGQEGEDHQLEYQAHKLKVCFDRFSDAVHDVAATDEPRDADAHDPRHLLLEKVFAAYYRVHLLAQKTMMDDGACKDLINELRELLGYVDPEKPTTGTIYRFDKREVKPITADTITNQTDGAGAGGNEDGQGEVW
ncbi:hypothetical protein G7054_g775 [Neopestalotiopsis clavispora]|nr:hypothetical protein G7054_g775 [Neopestalotiopsis clavispora]